MKTGILWAFATAAISGVSIFASKLFVSQLDPLVFTTGKNLLVAGALTIVLVLRIPFQELRNLHKRVWLQLLFIGIIGGGIPFYLFFTGLAQTSALGAAVIHKTLFIWVAILAYVFLKERLRPMQIIGYGLVTLGALWLGNFSPFSFGTGELMIASATMFWSLEYVMAKRLLHTVSPLIVSWARMTFGVIVLVGIMIFQGKNLSPVALSPLQFQAIFVGGILLLGYVLTWYKALAQAPATTVSLALASSPIITAVLTSIFLTHTVPVTDMAGLMLLGGGCALALLVPRTKKSTL